MSTNDYDVKFFTPNCVIKDEPSTPSDKFDIHDFDQCPPMRKSLSMNDVSALCSDLERCGFSSGTTNSQYSNKTSSVRQSAAYGQKFVSLAEAIYHFQRDTPGRFHSRAPKEFQPLKCFQRRGLTVAQSPQFHVKMRSRSVNFLSQQEREEMEIEEMRKFKIKANPVPKCVKIGSTLQEIPRRPVTVPEPFNLTENQKKIILPETVQVFKAKPAPKHILENPPVSVRLPIHTTKPISPKFHYKPLHAANSHSSLNRPSPAERPKPKFTGPVKPVPFSFERRDEELKCRKEEKIKRVIEQERKQANQFKAQPMPANIKKNMQKAVKSSCSSTSSENKENHVKFEARPPAVLYKVPFKPVLTHTETVKSPFELTTQKRAAEREKFDTLLREKEEQQEKLRLQRKKEEKEMEGKAVMDLRAKLVHHPKPAPKAQPFKPEPSNAALTIPETPKFVRRLKQH